MNELEFKSLNKNTDFTLIARDCVGGILYHQLGLKFLSPTINLFFTQEDFNYLCLNLKEYIDSELEEYMDENIEYPIGLLAPEGLKPIKIFFLHYDSYEEAKEKWNARKKRINWDNIYIVSTFCYATEKEKYNSDLIKDWNKIKYKKVILVDEKYGFDNEVVMKKNPKCTEFAWLLYSPDKDNLWRRTFNDYDFIKFLNDK